MVHEKLCKAAILAFPITLLVTIAKSPFQISDRWILISTICPQNSLHTPLQLRALVSLAISHKPTAKQLLSQPSDQSTYIPTKYHASVGKPQKYWNPIRQQRIRPKRNQSIPAQNSLYIYKRGIERKEKKLHHANWRCWRVYRQLRSRSHSPILSLSFFLSLYSNLEIIELPLPCADAAADNRVFTPVDFYFPLPPRPPPSRIPRSSLRARFALLPCRSHSLSLFFSHQLSVYLVFYSYFLSLSAAFYFLAPSGFARAWGARRVCHQGLIVYWRVLVVNVAKLWVDCVWEVWPVMNFGIFSDYANEIVI